MKKIFLFTVISTLLLSCGNEKEKKNQEKVIQKEYKVLLDVIYEKNDSIMLTLYDENDNEILEKRIVTAVKGSPLFQNVVFDLPKGMSPNNIGLGLSTNKEQTDITIKGVTVKLNEKTLLDGTKDSYLGFFVNNDCIIIDDKTLKHQIKHDKAYPPGLVGNDMMKSILTE